MNNISDEITKSIAEITEILKEKNELEMNHMEVILLAALLEEESNV